jgi:hypothetical protein
MFPVMMNIGQERDANAIAKTSIGTIERIKTVKRRMQTAKGTRPELYSATTGICKGNETPCTGKGK